MSTFEPEEFGVFKLNGLRLGEENLEGCIEVAEYIHNLMASGHLMNNTMGVMDACGMLGGDMSQFQTL